MRVEMNKRWKPALVTKCLESPRSYVVKTQQGREIRRNRCHLSKVVEDLPIQNDYPMEEETHIEEPNVDEHIRKKSESHDLQQSKHNITRSDRVSKHPDRLQVGQ